jgi:hypothetical protein
MREKFANRLGVAVLVILVGCGGDNGTSQRSFENFHYSYPLGTGGRFSLETFNGAVEISGWDEMNVDIGGTKHRARESRSLSTEVHVFNSPGSVEVRVIRPSPVHDPENPESSPLILDPRNYGARFIVKLPRQAVLEYVATSNADIRVSGGAGPSRLRTSHGSIQVQAFQGNLDALTSGGPIEVNDISGDVVAHTSNGHVHAEKLNGILDASTSNASVTAVLLAGQSGRPVRVETSNGSVDLTIPANFTSALRVKSTNGQVTLHLASPVNARVVARARNSVITSDFAVKRQGKQNKNSLNGVIGVGGPTFDLSTSGGSTRLLRM